MIEKLYKGILTAYYIDVVLITAISFILFGWLLFAAIKHKSMTSFIASIFCLMVGLMLFLPFVVRR